MKLSRLLSSIAVITTSASAFVCPPRSSSNGRGRSLRRISFLQLVTEADVIALVEKAEDLWGQVETLRKEANDLSLQAESLGVQAETSAADAMSALQQSISQEKIEEANQAQNLSIDLGALLDRVAQATKEADEIEVLADEALAASTAALEQHLIDFPENDETDTPEIE